MKTSNSSLAPALLLAPNKLNATRPRFAKSQAPGADPNCALQSREQHIPGHYPSNYNSKAQVRPGTQSNRSGSLPDLYNGGAAMIVCACEAASSILPRAPFGVDRSIKWLRVSCAETVTRQGELH
ncbi:hypothetical protein VTL71DRAFT_14075 [Oculimacula yallundae]|uniref:Uncharacterized protein n=1 Tax=Oculimacula yallundae TaxID=86028 RepID=A0ABR4CIT1_9HELO